VDTSGISVQEVFYRQLEPHKISEF
jgi:hypothetical protein